MVTSNTKLTVIFLLLLPGAALVSLGAAAEHSLGTVLDASTSVSALTESLSSCSVASSSFLSLDDVGQSAQCSICLCSLRAKRSVLPCDHSFHPSCIAHWMRWQQWEGSAKTTCPNCRQEFNFLPAPIVVLAETSVAVAIAASPVIMTKEMRGERLLISATRNNRTTEVRELLRRGVHPDALLYKKILRY